jgi:hypothetical protein
LLFARPSLPDILRVQLGHAYETAEAGTHRQKRKAVSRKGHRVEPRRTEELNRSRRVRARIALDL